MVDVDAIREREAKAMLTPQRLLVLQEYWNNGDDNEDLWDAIPYVGDEVGRSFPGCSNSMTKIKHE
ncbi:MAG: hypothetical protein V3V96_17445 [Acidiferrobacterales bacterium]